jgi:DNA-binding response OmpR family regulator
MKNNHPLIDIKNDECVKVTDEDIRDAERIENDPKKPQKIQTVWGVGYQYESV